LKSKSIIKVHVFGGKIQNILAFQYKLSIQISYLSSSWEKGNLNLKQILVSIDSSHHKKNKYLTPPTGNAPFGSYTPSKFTLNYLAFFNFK
jgi:hypothetical protein